MRRTRAALGLLPQDPTYATQGGAAEALFPAPVYRLGHGNGRHQQPLNSLLSQGVDGGQVPVHTR